MKLLHTDFVNNSQFSKARFRYFVMVCKTENQTMKHYQITKESLSLDMQIF